MNPVKVKIHMFKLKAGIKVSPAGPVRIYMVYLLQQFLLASLNTSCSQSRPDLCDALSK